MNKEGLLALDGVERVVQIGDAITLVQGDARVAYLGMFERSPCLVTDPPYLLTSGGGTGDTHFKGGRLKDYDNDGKPVECDISWLEIMTVIDALSSDRSDIYSMSTHTHIYEQRDAAKQVGLRYHNMICWDKGPPTPCRWYMNKLEYACYYFKGKARTINDPGSTHYTQMAPPTAGYLSEIYKIKRGKETAHKTEKPTELMAKFIRNSSRVGQLVTDPFMGSGTSGVAAVELQRRFLGFEIKPEYFDIAVKRITKAWNALLPHERASFGDGGWLE